jgi:hypothetical protein
MVGRRLEVEEWLRFLSLTRSSKPWKIIEKKRRMSATKDGRRKENYLIVK